jgi:uncharacterized membrane protein YphA (DoxX/SURF4 family)
MKFMVLPRVYLGVIFLFAAYSKMTIPVGFPKALHGFLSTVALPNAYSWYKPILTGLVLPHTDIFGPLTIVGETLAGIGLLLGLGTRVAAIIAIFLNCNYLCAKGLPLWAPASNDVPDIILALIVIAGSAGLYYGLDGVLTRNRSRRGRA